MVEDPIRVRRDGNGVVVEGRPADPEVGCCSARLTYILKPGPFEWMGGIILINGFYVDVSDDLPVLLGLMDSAPEEWWQEFSNDE
jgi:hypothetical protein